MAVSNPMDAWQHPELTFYKTEFYYPFLKLKFDGKTILHVKIYIHVL